MGTLDQRHISFDSRPESYSGFFNLQWARALMALTKDSKFDSAAIDLCMDWKGLSNTARMPYLMMLSLESLFSGMTSSDHASLKMINTIAARLGLEAGHFLSKMNTKKVSEIARKLAKEVNDGISDQRPRFDGQYLWDGFIQNQEFVLSIRSTQRICFVALLSGYEVFLKRCIREIKADQSWEHKSFSDLGRALDKHLFDGANQHLLLAEPVETARQLRNDLVHNGGRLRNVLLSRKDDFAITDDDQINIWPEQVNELFAALSGRVGDCARECISRHG